jgi:hypothetical protein
MTEYVPKLQTSNTKTVIFGKKNYKNSSGASLLLQMSATDTFEDADILADAYALAMLMP